MKQERRCSIWVIAVGQTEGVHSAAEAAMVGVGLVEVVLSSNRASPGGWVVQRLLAISLSELR